MPDEETHELAAVVAGKPLTLRYNKTVLTITRANSAKNRIQHVPIRQILWVELAEETLLQVRYLARRRKRCPLALVAIDARIEDASLAAVWVESLMAEAFKGVKQCKKLKVLVNPHGGVGKAASIYIKTVEPILRSARCILDATHTTHRKHAYEIAKGLSLEYDAVVALSGDGIIHEVINGFADHERPTDALAIPIAPIPTGSGNALSLNLLGKEDGFDVAAAVLNVLKGQPMKADLFSITMNSSRIYSFMSQAIGLMADLDIGTEHLRWMGDTRFFLGFLKGVMQFKPCPLQLSLKIAEKDKAAMVHAIQTRDKADGSKSDSAQIPKIPNTDLPLKPSPLDGPEWYTFEKPLLFVYGGQGPYVARDFMAFPVSLPDDGLIDIVAQELTTRYDVLNCATGAEKGESFFKSSYHYFKAHSYRVKPLSKNGTFAIDGEYIPFEEFQVEVHPRMVSFLSPLGTFAVDFPPSGRERRKQNA